MASVSTTAQLGLATILGAIFLIILAHGKDQDATAAWCKGEKCVAADRVQAALQSVPGQKSADSRSADRKPRASQIDRGGDKRAPAGAIADRKPKLQVRLYDDIRIYSEDVAAVADTRSLTQGSTEKSLRKKPARRLAKKRSKPAVARVNSPPKLVERSQPRRSRREDDPFAW